MCQLTPRIAHRISWTITLGVILVIGLITDPKNSYAAGWIGATVSNPAGGKVHQDASEVSATLGTYPAGAVMNVYDPPRNGFYSIYLKTPWKGAHYIWISQADIQIKSTERTPQSLTHLTTSRTVESNPQIEPADEKPSNWALDVNIAYSSILFQETDLASNFSMKALTGSLALDWRALPSPIELGADASYTFLPSSQSIKGINVSFLGSTLKAGLGFQIGPVRLDLLGGAYISSMSVTNNSFGYTPILLIGALPGITLNVGRRFAILANARYFPSLAGQLSPAELVGTAGLALRTRNNQKLTVQATYSRLTYGSLSTVGFFLQNLSFGLGYTF